MLLRKLKVGPRAGLGFSILAALSLILGGLALLQMKKMDSMSDEVNENWMPAMLASSEMGMAFGRVRALTLRMLLLLDEEAIRDSQQRQDTARRDLDSAQTTYASLINSDDERADYERFRSAKDRYFEQQKLVLDYVNEGKRADAVNLINTTLNELSNNVVTELKKLTEINQEGAQDAARRSNQVFNSAINVMLFLIAASLVLTVTLALLLTRSIVRPLAKCVEIAEQIASGDLRQDFKIDGEDEPAQLLRSLKKMQLNLRTTIQGISDSSSQLASASEELHAVTEDSTHGLHQQNNEIELAATAVNEMTVAAEEVARNAASTSEASRDTDMTAKRGREQVRQTVESINHLSLDVAHSTEEVEQLALKIRDISQVLDVIRSIAEQTNLLALNAAIEAARAGEQGRGFAVVADEVRALAHRTQMSTREIEQMISTIKQSTEQVVSAMQGSMTRTTSTLDIAQGAGLALDEIADSITSINGRNLVIASASEEQAQVAREVDRNLVNIRDLSVQTSAGANQTRASSQELSRLATDLNILVAKFLI